MFHPTTAGSLRSADTAFLDDVRRFLATALTSDLRDAGRNTIGVHSDIDACRVWHKRLFERGWIAPAWPAVHGGTNWTPAQRLTFERECAANDAPVLFAGGLRHFERRRFVVSGIFGTWRRIGLGRFANACGRRP
jgi:acyl-CoA dehydrogenase